MTDTNRVKYVGLGDLVRLTTKSIDEGMKVGLRSKLTMTSERLTTQVLDEEQVRAVLDDLQAFAPLRETIDAVRHAIRTSRDLQTFCSTMLRYVEEQGEMAAQSMRSMPDRPQGNNPQTASGDHYHRAQDEMERLAWDLINQS